MANPFSKLTKPTTLDPRTIKITEYEQYNSVQMKKINARLSSMKRSLPWIAAIGASFLLLSFTSDFYAKNNLFGMDYRGGQYLHLHSKYDQDHYAYNREFQRMQVVGEGLLPDRSKHSKQLIIDLGGNVPQAGSPHIRKQAPHEKFY